MSITLHYNTMDYICRIDNFPGSVLVAEKAGICKYYAQRHMCIFVHCARRTQRGICTLRYTHSKRQKSAVHTCRKIMRMRSLLCACAQILHYAHNNRTWNYIIITQQSPHLHPYVNVRLEDNVFVLHVKQTCFVMFTVVPFQYLPH